MISRRKFLQSLAATGVGAATFSSSAMASHADSKPSHVSITYNQSKLHEYRPLVDIEQEDKEKLIDLYGWIAESENYEEDVYVYWMSYTHQQAPWWGPETGHYSDHEPVQVEVDSETGEVQRVRASVYHWIKGEATADVVPLGGPNENNPRLRVINPHHQYGAASSEATVEAFEVKDLSGVYEGWIDNGLGGALIDGASVNPWVMRDQPDFWAPGKFGLPSTEVTQARIAKQLDFGVVGSLEGNA